MSPRSHTPVFQMKTDSERYNKKLLGLIARNPSGGAEGRLVGVGGAVVSADYNCLEFEKGCRSVGVAPVDRPLSLPPPVPQRSFRGLSVILR